MDIPSFDRITKLYEEGLHQSVIQLLKLSLDESRLVEKCDATLSIQELQSFLMFADSLHHIHDYLKAESIWSKILNLKKANSHPHLFAATSITTSTTTRRRHLNGGSVTIVVPFNEVEVRCQLATCRRLLKQIPEAVEVLSEIPKENRSLKIHYLLGQLYVEQKRFLEAKESFFEVLKINPLSLDCIQSLIKLGIKSFEIISVIGNVINNSIERDWLVLWIEIQSSLYSPKTTETIKLIKKLMSSFPQFNENIEMQITLSQAYYYNGDYKKTIQTYKSILIRDPTIIRGIDCYAASLYIENELTTLELLANRMISRCDERDENAEPWIVLAYFTFSQNSKDSRALIFSNNACINSNNSVESLLLRGRILMEAKGPAEAIQTLSEASQLSPYRFDIIEALTVCHIKEHNRPKVDILSASLRQFGQTPRVLKLSAQIILNDPKKAAPQRTKEAKERLEKAVSKDPTFLPAVYLLTKLYMEDKQYLKAIELLSKALEVENTTKLHKLIGDCYTFTNQNDKACHHLAIAKKMEVNVRSGIGDTAQSLNATNSTGATSSTPTTPGAGGGSSTGGRAGAGGVEIYSLEIDETHDSDDPMEEDTEWSDDVGVY